MLNRKLSALISGERRNLVCMLLIIGALAFATIGWVAASAPCMQYIFLCRSATSGEWWQNNPESVTDTLFTEPINAVGIYGTDRRRLGLSFVLSYLDGPPDKLDETLRRLLSLSEKHDVPVLIALDGENWWDYRSELWNWWDPSRPGYNPANRANVEWSGWGPECAVKIGWRNWGRQIRVLPQPNVASPAFRDASSQELVRLVTIIKQWRDHLPADKRSLFPGVKIGWEASVGSNAFYYPDGNSYLERYPKDDSHDPTTGLAPALDFTGGVAPLGYAALTAKGWEHPGPVTCADLGRITADYLAFLAHVCREAGLKREEIWTHAGGQLHPPWQEGYSHGVAINKDSLPGWSFYWDPDPTHAGDVGASLDAAHLNEWCAAEWLPAIHLGKDLPSPAAQWTMAYDSTLSFHDCRFVALYGWEGIRHNSDAINGLRNALMEPDPQR